METLGSDPNTFSQMWGRVYGKFVKATKTNKGCSGGAGGKATPEMLIQLQRLIRHVKHWKTESNMPSSPGMLLYFESDR